MNWREKSQPKNRQIKQTENKHLSLNDFDKHCYVPYHSILSFPDKNFEWKTSYHTLDQKQNEKNEKSSLNNMIVSEQRSKKRKVKQK